MDRTIEINPFINSGGWHIEAFNTETEEVAYWYGPRDECYRIARTGELPPGLTWIETTDGSSTPSDVATATGMYDRL